MSIGHLEIINGGHVTVWGFDGPSFTVLGISCSHSHVLFYLFGCHVLLFIVIYLLSLSLSLLLLLVSLSPPITCFSFISLVIVCYVFARPLLFLSNDLFSLLSLVYLFKPFSK